MHTHVLGMAVSHIGWRLPPHGLFGQVCVSQTHPHIIPMTPRTHPGVSPMLHGPEHWEAMHELPLAEDALDDDPIDDDDATDDDELVATLTLTLLELLVLVLVLVLKHWHIPVGVHIPPIPAMPQFIAQTLWMQQLHEFVSHVSPAALHVVQQVPDADETDDEMLVVDETDVVELMDDVNVGQSHLPSGPQVPPGHMLAHVVGSHIDVPVDDAVMVAEVEDVVIFEPVDDDVVIDGPVLVTETVFDAVVLGVPPAPPVPPSMQFVPSRHVVCSETHI